MLVASVLSSVGMSVKKRQMEEGGTLVCLVMSQTDRSVMFLVVSSACVVLRTELTCVRSCVWGP